MALCLLRLLTKWQVRAKDYEREVARHRGLNFPSKTQSGKLDFYSQISDYRLNKGEILLINFRKEYIVKREKFNKEVSVACVYFDHKM